MRNEVRNKTSRGTTAAQRLEDGAGLVQSYRSRRWRACHVVFVAIGWLVFAVLWWRVLVRPGAAADVRDVLTKVGILTAVVAVVTRVWIAHNVALARRRGGRNRITPLVLPTTDLLERRMVMAPDAATASIVVVRVNGSVKQFFSGDRAGV